MRIVLTSAGPLCFISYVPGPDWSFLFFSFVFFSQHVPESVVVGFRGLGKPWHLFSTYCFL